MNISDKSSFVRYEMTEPEIKTGSVFTLDQRAVMQNLIADAAEEKIALTFDTNNPQQFIQREAELTGQIGILKYLLDLQSQYKE